jgi:plasmid stability protein
MQEMATLNIKNVPEKLYKKLRAQAKKDLRSISPEVLHLLQKALEAEGPRSILELRGLGKDVWKKVNPAKHIRRERDSWD